MPPAGNVPALKTKPKEVQPPREPGPSLGQCRLLHKPPLPPSDRGPSHQRPPQLPLPPHRNGADLDTSHNSSRPFHRLAPTSEGPMGLETPSKPWPSSFVAVVPQEDLARHRQSEALRLCPPQDGGQPSRWTPTRSAGRSGCASRSSASAALDRPFPALPGAPPPAASPPRPSWTMYRSPPAVAPDLRPAVPPPARRAPPTPEQPPRLESSRSAEPPTPELAKFWRAAWMPTKHA
mmetsp:Transcript_18639/g.44170  ORF Transcript_18639/g.44170 Transcript_18639/m.44170 type:complete len:235 (+) Transcript_18639:504-1208(+)